VHHPKAKVVTERLMELNPAVKGTFEAENLNNWICKNVDVIADASLIILSDVDHHHAIKVSISS